MSAQASDQASSRSAEAGRASTDCRHAARRRVRSAASMPASSSTASVSAPRAGARRVRRVRGFQARLRRADRRRPPRACRSASGRHPRPRTRASHSSRVTAAHHARTSLTTRVALVAVRVLQRHEVRPPDPLAEPLPELRLERAEREPLPVRRFVDVVAGVRELAGRRKHRPRHRRIVNRHVDDAAERRSARAAAARRGCRIAACVAAPMSPTSGPGSCGRLQQPRERLVVDVVRGALGVRAGLAEPADRRAHQARMACAAAPPRRRRAAAPSTAGSCRRRRRRVAQSSVEHRVRLPAIARSSVTLRLFRFSSSK